jgi:Ca-activated chloride channel family protein
MKRLPAIHIIGVLGAISLSSGLWLTAAGDDFTIRNEVRLVLLDVSVQNRDGNFITGLSKGDFTVFENGQPQAITVFDSGDAPVTMGVLVDESSSMAPKRDQVLTAAQALIAESNPHDEVFVLNFNDSVKRGLPEGILFSDSIPQLHAALYRERPAGKTALYDAVVDGLRQLGDGRQSRKTLVVISDGGDNASRYKRIETAGLVERSAATVYAIGLYDEGDSDADPGVLRQLAKKSGGRAWFPRDVAALPGVCQRIAKEIRTRYTVGYVPREDTKAAPLRHIQVKVSSPDEGRLNVLTRTTYRYDELPTK